MTRARRAAVAAEIDAVGRTVGFLASYDKAPHVMWANSYERRAGAPEAEPGRMRMGAHSDYGSCTVLLADPVPGLRILGVDGTWHDVVPKPGSFLVDLGDLLAEWTNHRWRSTVHRAVPPPPGAGGPFRRRSARSATANRWRAADTGRVAPPWRGPDGARTVAAYDATMLSELAAAVRSGAVEPVDLVAESLRRIEAAAELNAVVALRAEEALAEARAHSRTGALAGLPLLVKDMARCAGMRTTMGHPMFADAAPDTVDDTVVARLRAAGAIVLGRTNSPAFGHQAVTTNTLYGPTRNPWKPQRSPGGSSGGSAAALAAGLAPLATTSDGGGSVRIPASCCGLVGYKPSMGAIGRNILPRWIGFSTQGATGATVADVVAEASVTLGPARGDWLSLPPMTLTPTRPTRVVACRTFRADIDPVIEAAFDEALATLAAEGLVVERVAAPSDASMARDWFTMSAAELAQSLEEVRDQWANFEPSLRFQLEFGASVTMSQYLAATRRRHDASARFDDLLDPGTVLVVPTANVQSWMADGPVWDRAGSVTGDPAIGLNTPELNYTGHPCVSVPLGLDEAGVPFGLQVVAPRFADGLALGLAAVLERVRPWPLVAPGYVPFAAAFAGVVGTGSGAAG